MKRRENELLVMAICQDSEVGYITGIIDTIPGRLRREYGIIHKVRFEMPVHC